MMDIFPKKMTLAPASEKVEAPVVSLSTVPTTGCAALGYVHRKGVAFSIPFEATSEFRLMNDGNRESFRTGIAKLPDGRPIGILRISEFRATEFPAECTKAWKQLARKKSNRTCDKKCSEELSEIATTFLFNTMKERIGVLKKSGVSALVIDLGGNSGGNDTGDWLPRLFSNKPVRSPSLGLVRDPNSAKYFDEQLEGIRDITDKETLAENALTALKSASTEFTRMMTIVKEPRTCSMNWVWHEQRPWNPLTSECTHLVFGKSFASGAYDYLPVGALGSLKAETQLYWPATVAPFIGSWSGPVYVVTDKRTASAAEASAAVFQDNKVARIIGTRTAGLGCGFMYSSEFVLPHSRLRFRIPNCVRLRQDGTNEAKGVDPDILIPFYDGENDTQRAVRFLNSIAKDQNEHK